MDRAAIAPELVSQLIADQFPEWAHLPVQPVAMDGWDNATFRLGAELSVRLPSAECYVAQVDKEHRWLPILAPQLPVRIPEPVARGRPAHAFPRPWSVYRWLPGEPASVFSVADLSAFATALAGFLTALQQADASGGPPPGEHNFYRGGRLAVYDQETRDAIRALRGEIDSDAATYVWEAALAAQWDGQPVWVHGDVAPSNLLVLDGRLSAVIDFGCSAVGDPACDLTVTWTFFVGDSRRALHAGLPLDDGTWARARGWALWKALMTLVSADEAVAARTRFGWRLDAAQMVDEVIAEHRRRLAQS